MKGSLTFVSLNSRLKRSKDEEEDYVHDELVGGGSLITTGQWSFTK